MSKFIKYLSKSGLFLAALGVLSLPFAASAIIPADSNLTRLAGADRYKTAVEISKEMHPTDNTQDYVVVTRGDLPYDALAVAPLAAYKDASILTTKSDELSTATRDEIERTLMDDANTDDVIILGGTSAVSQDVEDAIKEIKISGHNIGVKRYAGSSRYETAKKIREALDAEKGLVDTAFLVTGEDWPDALSVGAVAGNPALASGYNHVFLTPSDTLDPDVASYMSDNSGTLKKVYVVGGTSAISDAVLTDADNRITTVTRIADTDRYGTNKAFNEVFHGASHKPTKIGVATGEAFADALGLGVFMATKKAPLVMTKHDDVPSKIESYIKSYKDTIGSGWLAGGTSAVTDAVKAAIEGFYM